MHRLNLKLTDLVTLAAICTCWTVLQMPHLQLDPWMDELHTLRHFVLVPLERSVTDYTVPNNHILFSVMLNVFRRVVGVNGLDTVLDRIFLLRILPLLFSLGTIASVYLTTLRRAGALAALLASLLLMGSVPFFNYACQLRGYGLSMFLLALLVFQILSVRPRMLAIVPTTAAFIWVLPSNAYLLAAIIAGLIICPPLRSGEGRLFWHRNIIAGRTETKLPALYISLTGLVAGGVLGGMLYFPVYDQIRTFTSARGSGFSATPLSRTLPVVLWHFLSGRWTLLLLPVAYLAVRMYHRQVAFPERLLMFVLIALIGPFAFSAVRGDGAPDRVFLSVLPLVCVGWGGLSGRAIEALRQRTRVMLTGLYGLCCALALIGGWWTGKQKALTDRLGHERCADLYFQYYLVDFTPRADARRFIASYRDEAPIVNAAVQDVELVKYLQLEGRTVLPGDSLMSFARRRVPVFAVTDGPSLQAGAGTTLPITEMPGVLRQPGIYRISWRKPAGLR